MPTQISAKVKCLLLGIVASPVNRVAGHRHAKILQRLGRGIIDQQIRTLKTFPRMIVIMRQKPCRVTFCRHRGVGGHDDAAILHFAHARMDFARNDRPVERAHFARHIKAKLQSPIAQAILIKHRRSARRQFRAQRHKDPAFRCDDQIPDRIRLRIECREHRDPHPVLRDQIKKVGRQFGAMDTGFAPRGQHFIFHVQWLGLSCSVRFSISLRSFSNPSGPKALMIPGAVGPPSSRARASALRAASCTSCGA